MDGDRFDSYVRSLTQVTPRRAVTRLLGGIALTGALGGQRPDAIEAGKKKNKKKKKKKDKDGCKQHCGGGTLCCGGNCIDVVTDRNNCGACGNQCPTGQYCFNATCAPCEDPFALCGSLGVERCVDLRSDRQNCGSCGFACPTDPTTPARNFICENKQCICTGNVCENGRCCPDGFNVCNAGGGCCPNGYTTFCPNNPDSSKCCPAGYKCGGSCGQPCCK